MIYEILCHLAYQHPSPFHGPLLLACPQAEPIRIPPVFPQEAYSEDKLLTYDDLLEFIEEI